jgi:hypothetical protein
MPEFEKIPNVTGGTPSARGKLNSTIGVANSVRAVRGDGIIRSTHAQEGVALSLDIESLKLRLPVYSKIKYGAAANIAARSDSCAWILAGGDVAPYCYVKEVSNDFPLDPLPGSSGSVSSANEDEFTKVYFPGNYSPVVKAGNLIPYSIVKDPENVGAPYGVCISGGFWDLPLGSVQMVFGTLLSDLHDGWIKSRNDSGYRVGSDLSDAGTYVTPDLWESTFPFGTGAEANTILATATAGNTDSAIVNLASAVSGDNVIYGVGVDYYIRIW